MALTSVVPVGAVTIAELQAQIAALMAQLQSLQGGSATVSVTFTRDLTVGSSGSDVTALQQILVSKGYLTMPAGVAYGYFGGLTKAAVARWQAASGIAPAAGYFGAKSRAALSVAGGTTTGGTTTGGTTTGGTTTSGSITTPGAEGTMTVTSAPVSNSTVYAGDRMDTVLAFNVKANNSDIAIQRVKVDLGTNTQLYSRVFETIYVVDDAGRTLGSLSMNSTNVVKDADDHYYATLTGFSSVVSKNAQRTYSVKADLRSSIDSTYRTSHTVTLPDNGVRAVDGAGIDLYGPSADITSTITVSQSLAENAQITVSTDANTPAAQEVVASSGANNNEYDKLPVLVFAVKAEKDDVKITDLNNVVITMSGGAGATASTSYLYAGNGVTGSLLGTSAVSGSDADFSNISYTIPKGTTQSFTIAVNVRSATTTAGTIAATVSASGIEALNTNGDTVTNLSGSATSNNIVVRSLGPVITLNGAPTISKNSTSFSGATSSALATFNLNIKAVGGDVYFGPQASSTFGFQVYQNGSAVTLSVASSTSWSVPSSGAVTSGGNITTGGFKIAQGNSVTLPVSFYFEGRTATGGNLITSGAYSVGLSSVKWSTDGSTANQQTSTFMAGQNAWRTADVIMP